MADSSQTRISYISEVTYGVTPATPAFKNLRYTGGGLNKNINFVSSSEIRPDRNVPDLTQVSGDAGGDIAIEMSYGSFDDILEGLLQSTWATNVLKNGVTPKSFTIEQFYENGTTDQFHRYLGARVNSLSLNIRAGEILTGSFGFMAKGATSATTAIAGAAYTAANSNPVINAATDFRNLAMSGITSPSIMAMTLNITNNLYQKPVIGSIDSKGIGSGQFVVTGTMDAYFDTSDMYDAYINNTATDLEFEIGGASASKYKFDMGKVKFSASTLNNPGNNQDIMQQLQFQAIYNASDLATLVVTRTP